jgi:hypothetical protein
MAVGSKGVAGVALLVAALTGCRNGGGGPNLGPSGRAGGNGSDAGAGGAAGGRTPDAGSTGGGDVATGGAAGAPIICPMQSPSFNFWTATEGPQGGSYGGPAVVERSVPTELTLAFYAEDSVGDGGASSDGGGASADGGGANADGGVASADGGGARSLPLHASIGGLGDTPAFPVGARVWLEKTPAGPPPPAFQSPSTFFNGTFVVRDKKDGAILIAGAHNTPGPIPTSPGGQSCTDTTNDGACSYTYGSLDVHGDMTVLVGNGETRTVPIGGVGYDVSVTDMSFTSFPGACGGDVPSSFSEVDVSVRAKDLATLVKTLPKGTVPACSRGNYERKWPVFDFFDGTTVWVPYEGPASYTGRVGRCFEFSATGRIDPTTNAPAKLDLCEADGLLVEPTVGTSFWLSMPTLFIATLRSAKDGPFVLASFEITSTGAHSAAADQTLGVHVDIRRGCAYASMTSLASAPPATLSLDELVFATAPPVVVGTDDHALVTLGGKAYDAWFARGSGFTLTAN